MSFKRAVAVICAIVMLCTSTDVLAYGTLLLPASLVEIEEGAFEGDSSMRGLVTLPNTVNNIGDHAFAGTGIYALSLPTSVKTVGHQIGSGQIYVMASSKDTVFSSDSLQGVRYAFGNAAGNMSEAGAQTFYPVSEIKSSSGFYYHVASGKARLLCAVDPDAIGRTVRVPETVSGATVVDLAPDAFAGCNRISLVQLPAAVHAYNAAFTSCPTAVVEYYSNGFAVEYIVTLAPHCGMI